MRMRGKKVIFNYKDTFDLHRTLSPVIYEGLKKFRDVVVKSKQKGGLAGIPGALLLEKGIELGSDYDFDKVFAEWVSCLDKMIYAFNIEEEPELEDFDVDFSWTEDGIHCQNPAGYVLYNKAEKEWVEKKEEGQMLFAKYFDSLWW